MNIRSIEITNVKGIEHEKFDLKLMPNKPNLLIAPNGSGKSSIAVAFDSMNRNRMTLDDNDCYQCDKGNQPELTLTVEDDSRNTQTLAANNSQNEICSQFDIIVIRSGLIPKATKRNMGRFTQVSASLEIQSIPICKIPNKVTFNYQYSAAKSSFGKNGKVLPNISGLFRQVAICDAIAQCDWGKFAGARIQQKIAGIKDQINQQSGNSDAIRQWVTDNVLDQMKSIGHLNLLSKQ